MICCYYIRWYSLLNSGYQPKPSIKSSLDIEYKVKEKKLKVTRRVETLEENEQTLV